MDSEQISKIKQELRDSGYNIYVYSYPCGMYFPEHVHNYPKLHIVLSGTLKVKMPDGEVVLGQGDRLEVPANVPHMAEVLGDGPMVCIDATLKSH
jgi:mannose-6-phosphate isomerase-like protein (cupin superfamily)